MIAVRKFPKDKRHVFALAGNEIDLIAEYIENDDDSLEASVKKIEELIEQYRKEANKKIYSKSKKDNIEQMTLSDFEPNNK